MYQWLGLCVKNLGVSMNDFWDMPLFMVIELIRSVTPQQANHISRKEILDQARRNYKLRGWVC